MDPLTWHLHPMTWHLDPIRGRVDAWDLVTDLLAASPLPNPVVCHVSPNDANESSDKISRSSARARLREWRVRTSARPRLGGSNSNSNSARVSFDGGFDVRTYAAAVADRVRVLATEWPRGEGGRRLAGVGAVAAAHGRRRG